MSIDVTVWLVLCRATRPEPGTVDGMEIFDDGSALMLPPAPDWVTDFDHAHPAYNADAPAIWDDLRTRCPVAHTNRYGGAHLPVTYDLVREVAYDHERFSSRSVVVSNVAPVDLPEGGEAPPITADPPFHHAARRMLLPAFSPRAVDARADEVRAVCRATLEGVPTEQGGVFDAARDYARHIPVQVIARMLGFPVGDAELFRRFVHDVLEAVDVPVLERLEAFEQLSAYIDAQIVDHVAEPRDDLTSYLIAQIPGSEHEGAARARVGGTIVLLLVAGIDTTWSAIASALWHLATHRDDLDRLVADPSLLDAAVEEFLRAYAPVTMARVATRDTDLAGCPVRAGEWVLLPFPAANRDPAVFDDAATVRIDRSENRHAAFGLGIHRCLGSNLARLELRVAIEEFIVRYPSFALTDPDAVSWSVGQVRGPRSVPVVIN